MFENRVAQVVSILFLCQDFHALFNLEELQVILHQSFRNSRALQGLKSQGTFLNKFHCRCVVSQCLVSGEQSPGKNKRVTPMSCHLWEQQVSNAQIYIHVNLYAIHAGISQSARPKGGQEIQKQERMSWNLSPWDIKIPSMLHCERNHIGSWELVRIIRSVRSAGRSNHGCLHRRMTFIRLYGRLIAHGRSARITYKWPCDAHLVLHMKSYWSWLNFPNPVLIEDMRSIFIFH